jgi:protein-S-isoprenylcysteine O-methyltransferase Ste14
VRSLGVLIASGKHSMSATLPSIVLQKVLDFLRKEILPMAPSAARLVGFQLHSERPAERWGSVGVFALGLIWLGTLGSSSIPAALGCFLIAIALRFGFLFASFRPRGVASRLIVRFGVERGHVIYGMALDLLSFAQRLALIALSCATAREASGVLGSALQLLGLVLVPVGIGATLWATRAVGQDAYHYRDLFTGSRNVRLEDGGPYAICSNPMYALGPLAGYGLAMLALSPLALFASGLNQALLFVFNQCVEQPRLRRADSIFVETQRRYELARSLLGFDPRQELSRLRHVDSSEQSAPAGASQVAG